MNIKGKINVILGASGGVGSVLMSELASQGKRIRAVTRSGGLEFPSGVETLHADLMTPEGARSAVSGAAVVYHCAQPEYHRWAQEFPRLNETIISAVSGTNSRLIFCDNLYMYGSTKGSMTEDTPYNPNSKKGSVRVELADALMAAHSRGDVQVAIGRASDYYGPGMLNTAFGDTVFANAVQGKAANVIGNPDMPHTLIYIRDFARGLIVLGEAKQAPGEIWHIPSAETVTVRRFLEMVYREVGQPLKISSLSGLPLTILGTFVPILRELKDIRYQFEEPFIMDHSKFLSAFGPFDITSYKEGIRKTVAWFRENTQN